jgi:intracellular sulfur oxidation DsrE/DsrF family protein
MSDPKQSDPRTSSVVTPSGVPASNQPYPAGRRGFVARFATAATAVAAGLALPRRLTAAIPDTSPDSSTRGPGEEWMSELKGKHRTVLDLAAHKNGKPLQQAKNYLDAWRDAYRVSDRDVNLVIGIHGEGLPLVLGDEFWSRYRLGEQYEITDVATKAPAVRNVFAEGNVVADGPVTREQSVEALQRRGVRFLVCMNTIAGAAKKLAAAGFGAPGEIQPALLGGLLPGVITVPAMVVTFTRLQEFGLKYTKIS